ncbi:hypothetical protein [Archangium lansingense]|uniref:DUF5666 domain-containing protein n=1 Tax=Archangium lansingense TaxID=2995310 RepID=A0ABT4AMS5_9BACT|nr:hypothetical protein [Archangium lansinium]MCY1082997.1 hypothetical protein [Archangium lansinium]
MRKPTWWDFGIAVLALVLVCGAAQGEAQYTQYPANPEGDDTQDSRTTGTSDGMGSDQGLPTGTTAPQTGVGTGGSGMGPGTDAGQATGQAADTQDETVATQQPSQADAQQRVEIARLRAQVATLEQQLAQMRVALARAQAAAQGEEGRGQGVGGSGQGVSGSGTGGTASSGDPNAEAPARAAGVGSSPSTPGGAGGGGTAGGSAAAPSAEGYAVATVIHRGRVRSVNPQQLVIEEEGGDSNTLSLAQDVRVTRNGQQMSLRNLKEGSMVRTSADLYARGNPVTSIEVLSAPAGSGK